MIHQINNKVIGVVVPEGSKGFVLVSSSHVKIPFIYIQGQGKTIDLPEGKYEIVNLVSECSEEEARGLGYKYHNGHENYFNRQIDLHRTALESLHSFAKSVGVEPDRLLIIKMK